MKYRLPPARTTGQKVARIVAIVAVIAYVATMGAAMLIPPDSTSRQMLFMISLWVGALVVCAYIVQVAWGRPRG